MTIIQATSIDQLKPIIELQPEIFNDNNKQVRLNTDFTNGLFQVYFNLKNGHSCITNADSISAYAVTYFSYSTWQHRVLSIADFWYDSTLEQSNQLIAIEQFRDKLFSEARKFDCKRVNFFVSNSTSNKQLLSNLEELGMRNLSKEEDWHIFQLGTNELDEFVKDVPELDETKYRIIKVENMADYASHIQNSIHDLAVFEKLEDQFECTVESKTLKFNYEYIR